MAGAWWSPTDDSITVLVRATPGAKRSEVVGVVEGRLRLRIHAPAVEGKANAELIRFLAAWTGLRGSAVTIVRGEHAREKTVHLRGLDAPPAVV